MPFGSKEITQNTLIRMKGGVLWQSQWMDV